MDPPSSLAVIVQLMPSLGTRLAERPRTITATPAQILGCSALHLQARCR
jgi:hypothetical protein